MSLVDHLMQTRTSMEMAKELARTARENAHLQDRIARLEVELFWLTSPLPAPREGILHHALKEHMAYTASLT